ncbi:MAG: hypothetical protein MUE75_11390 [Algoriphagus sp.]|jgi:hypothetical protein|nr:hypothetical protein [Algoriphagus sp.]
MNLIKKTVCFSLLVLFSFSLIPYQGIAQDLELPGAGCAMTVLGEEIKCTRVWCSSTMSMSGCDFSGALASQTCDKMKSC